MKQYRLLIFCLLAFAFGASAQVPQIRDTTQRDLIHSLSTLEKRILKPADMDDRLKANDEFLKLFRTALQKDYEASTSFDSLKIIGSVRSDDGRLRIFAWSLPDLDGNHYTFYGFVQIIHKTSFLGFFKKIRTSVIELKDAGNNFMDPENTFKNGPSQWYGAYYYSLITKTQRGRKVYVLLGWKGNNMATTRKVIESLSLQGDKITFGLPVFKIEKMTKARVIYEFNARIAMHLHYEKNALVADLDQLPKGKKKKKKKLVRADLIIADHLSVSDQKNTGNYEYYGPDLSYDAFRFKSGKWVFYPAVDVRNEDKKINNTDNRVLKSKKPKQGEDEFYRKYK